MLTDIPIICIDHITLNHWASASISIVENIFPTGKVTRKQNNIPFTQPFPRKCQHTQVGGRDRCFLGILAVHKCRIQNPRPNIVLQFSRVDNHIDNVTSIFASMEVHLNKSNKKEEPPHSFSHQLLTGKNLIATHLCYQWLGLKNSQSHLVEIGLVCGW